MALYVVALFISVVSLPAILIAVFCEAAQIMWRTVLVWAIATTYVLVAMGLHP